MPAEPDPVEIATRALRHRDRSRAEIDRRLAGAGIDDDRRAEALETLERVGYVDDERYAASRAASLAARGRGDAAIGFELEQQGLSRDQVAAAVATLEPEAARAVAIAGRLGRTAKTAARLARSGFSDDSIATAVGPDVAPGDDGGV